MAVRTSSCSPQPRSCSPSLRAGATKIESQHRDIPAVQGFGRLINNLVMHRAAKKRMGMAHESDEAGI